MPSLYARILHRPSRKYAGSYASPQQETSTPGDVPAPFRAHRTGAYPATMKTPVSEEERSAGVGLRYSQQPKERSLNPLPQSSNPTPLESQRNTSSLIKPCTIPLREDDKECSDVDSDSDQEDIFYTPLSSPRNSLALEEIAMRFPSIRSNASSTTISTVFDDPLFVQSTGSLPLSESTRQTSVSGHELPAKGRYTDADWAQETLGPNYSEAGPSTPRRRATSVSTASTSSSRPRQRKKGGAKQRGGPIVMSMSAVLEEDEGENLRPGSIRVVHPPGNSMPRILGSRPSTKARSIASNSSSHHRKARSVAGPQDAFSVYESAHSGELHEPLPSVTAIPSQGTQGYSSLVLPRAPPSALSAVPHRATILPNTKIDLTRSNVAQTTMATVEVVRGLSAPKSGTGTRRVASLSRNFRLGGTKNDAPAGMPLGFTSHRAPPTTVPASSLLIQVWAVGVDSVDQRLVGVEGLALSPMSTLSGGKSSKSPSKRTSLDPGFCPGRSFVGRVMESGWEVRDDAFKRGEWVAGLLDVRKSGALAEFIIAERHRVQRVPYPLMAPTLVPCPALTLEELALLPLCGVPAYRAVRTLSFALEGHGHGHHPRVLVLCGHDGAGAMATQMIIRRGWAVVVHVPGFDLYGHIDDDDNEQDIPGIIEQRIMAWGAQDVVFDESVGAASLIARLHALGEEFDGILDTVGGKDVWQAGEQLLLRGQPGAAKQFTTLVGDFPDRAVPSAKDHFRAGLRSWKGGDGKGKSPKVGYAWISVGSDVDWEGHDVRDAIGETLRSGVRPLVRKVVPFERAPDAFQDAALAEGGSVVFRVVDN